MIAAPMGGPMGGGITPLARRRPLGPNQGAPGGRLPTAGQWGGMVNAPATALPAPGLALNDTSPTPPIDAATGQPVPALGTGPVSRADGSPFLAPQTPALTPLPMPGGAPPGSALDPNSRYYGTPGAAAPTLGSGPASRGGYAAMSSYGPGADLRGTQIAPAASAATQGAQGAANQALGSYASWQAAPWQGVAAGSYAPGADTTGLRGSLSQALAALQSAPDRGQLAAQNFSLLDQTAGEASARDQRTIGQSASKFGRIGSGITTTNLGDLGERQAIDRSRAQSQMSLDAAGQTMGDRLNVAGALQSGFGALSGADLNNAGFSQSLRNEARGERDASNAFNAADFARRGQLFGDTANYAQQQTANDASRRDELRGERAYQTGMEGQAYDRNRQAIGDATSQSNNALNQALSLLGGGTSGTDLASLLQRTGTVQGAQAGSGGADIASLLQAYFANRGH